MKALLVSNKLAANASHLIARQLQTAIFPVITNADEHREFTFAWDENRVHWESEIPVSDPHERQAQICRFDDCEQV